MHSLRKELMAFQVDLKHTAQVFTVSQGDVISNRRLNFKVGANTPKDVLLPFGQNKVKTGAPNVGVQVHEVKFLSLVLSVTLPLHVPRDLMLRGLVLRQLL